MLENDDKLTNEEKIAKKEELLTNYSIKSERVHTINQLLKAYTMFDRDVEYVVTEQANKIHGLQVDIFFSEEGI